MGVQSRRGKCSDEAGPLDLVHGRLQALLEQVGPDRHLQRVEGVLEGEVGVQLVDLVEELVHPGLGAVRHHHELDPGESLVAVQPEGVSLDLTDTGGTLGNSTWREQLWEQETEIQSLS